MKMRLHPFDLRLAHRFTISRGSIDVQPTLIVALEDQGLVGWGEATANDYYGHTVASMTEHLERLRSTIEATVWSEPAELHGAIQDSLAGDPFALCALDQAAHDLWGKRHGRATLELFGGSFDMPRPDSNFTIGLDRIETMVAKLRETPDWPCYKVKLGTADDVAIIERLRRETAVPFRVDANGGWTVDEAIDRIGRLAALEVELIEQPLHADAIDRIAQVRRATSLPLIADENCQVFEDVRRCADAGFTGINIKLVKCGGMTVARRMIDQARQLGLQVMIGCMTESSVGISAIAQFLPWLDFVDMDGAALLAGDVADGVVVERGVCRYPSRLGNGVIGLRPGV
ncbi:MAG TPA: dipeptide epimerase [Planctomycetaceae bacterium]|nr:dipeptide epimerase [Planctomycetaceae bacterium]HRF00979.1 dipeptide epimerase [Pirellulaceae bacterium]